MEYFLKKKRFHPFKRRLQQNWRAQKYAGCSRTSCLNAGRTLDVFELFERLLKQVFYQTFSTLFFPILSLDFVHTLSRSVAKFRSRCLLSSVRACFNYKAN